MTKVLLNGVSAFLVSVVMYAGLELAISSFGYVGDAGLDWVRVLLVAGSVLFGIFGRSGHDVLVAEKSDTVNIAAVLRNVFRAKIFWKAVFVSPLVIAALYPVIQSFDSWYQIAIVGIQNGYFWHAFFDTRKSN